MVRVNVVRHDPPGPVAGSVLGVAVGLLLGSIWAYGGPEVAAAVTAVVLGLVAALVAGSGWRPFGVALAALAVIACVAMVLWV